MRTFSHRHILTGAAAALLITLTGGLSSCISISFEDRDKKHKKSEPAQAQPLYGAEPTEVPPYDRKPYMTDSTRAPYPSEPPQPAKLPERAHVVGHTVERGDSLWKLSKEYQTTIAEIRAANGITGDTIIAGQTLQIPTDHPPQENTGATTEGTPTPPPPAPPE